MQDFTFSSIDRPSVSPVAQDEPAFTFSELDAAEALPSQRNARIERARAPRDAGDVLGDALTPRGFASRTPFVQYGAEGYGLKQQVDLARKIAAGDASEEEAERFSAMMREGARPTTIGADILDVVLDIPAFVMEFGGTGKLLGGGAVLGAKESAKRFMAEVAKDAAERSIRKAGTAALGAAAYAGREVAARTAIMEAGGMAAGALTPGTTATGMAQNNALRLVLQDVPLTQDEMGNLSVALDAYIPSMVEKLPAGTIQALAEVGSEMSGGVFAPMTAKLRGLQYALLKRVVGESGAKSAEAAMRALARKGGFHGVLEEMGEERINTAVQALAGSLTGLEGLEGWEDIVPTWRQATTEFVAFLVPGAAVRAGAAIAGTPAPASGTESITTEGDREVRDGAGAGVPTPVAAPGGTQAAEAGVSSPAAAGEPGPVAAAGPTVYSPAEVKALINKQFENDPRVGALEVVETEQHAGTGLHLVRVKPGEAGAGQGASSLPFNGAFIAPGIAVVREGAENEQGLPWHEAVHSAAKQDAAGYTELWESLTRLDPDGLRQAAETYAGLDAALWERLTGGQRQEETAAQQAESLAGYLEMLSTEQGAQSLERLAAEPTLLQKLVRAVLGALQKLGLEITPRQQAELREVESRLGEPLLAHRLEAAREIHAWLQANRPNVKLGRPRPARETPKQRRRREKKANRAEARASRPNIPSGKPDGRKASKPAEEQAKPKAAEPAARGKAVPVGTETTAQRRRREKRERRESAKAEGRAEREAIRALAAEEEAEQREAWFNEQESGGEQPERTRDITKDIRGLGSIDLRRHVDERGKLDADGQALWDRFKDVPGSKRLWLRATNSKAKPGLSIEEALGQLVEDGWAIEGWEKTETAAGARGGTHPVDALLGALDGAAHADDFVPFSPAPSTDSAAFRRWFGDSKVVDANGDPLVVYHGTGAAAGLTQFSFNFAGKGADQYGPGFYFTTSPVTAAGYTTRRNQDDDEKPGGEDSPATLPVYLAIRNPLRIDALEHAHLGSALELEAEQALALLKAAPDVMHPEDSPLGDHFSEYWDGGPQAWMLDALAEQYSNPMHIMGDFYRDSRMDVFLPELSRVTGYDGVEVTFKSGERHYVAFRPTQVKSATGNRGTYDLADPDIRFSPRPAYHGSPHRFDKFSLDAIGSGEGAQVYGWGLYFAGKREVAEHYKQFLGGETREVYIDGKLAFKDSAHNESPEHRAAYMIAVNGSTEKALEASAELQESLNHPAHLKDVERAIWALDGRVETKTVKHGHGYTVELAPEESEYLLWDKPLSEQSEHVRAALSGLHVAEHFGYSLPAFKALPADRRVSLAESVASMELEADFTEWSGEEIYKGARGDGSSDREASEELRAIGIRGIKYLDGTSRADGDGSYNYVLFDDADVRITGRWSPRPKIKAPLVEHSPEMAPESFRDKVRRKLQDERLPLRRFEEWLRDVGGKVKASAYDLATNIYGQKVHALHELDRDYLKKIDSSLNGWAKGQPGKRKGKREKAYELLSDYAMAVHRPERLRRLQDREGANVDIGMTEAEAAEIIANAPAEIVEAHRHLIAMNHWVRRQLLEHGHVTQEWFDREMEEMPNYVPLRTEEAEADWTSQVPRRGRGFHVPGPEFLATMGRSSKASNVAYFSYVQAGAAIDRTRNGNVGRAFYQILLDNPTLTNWEEVEQPEDIDGFKTEPDGVTFEVKVDGETKFIKITSERLAASLKNLSQPELGPVLAFSGKVTRFLAQMSTSLNPAFVLPNIVRDALQAGIALGEQSQVSYRSVVASLPSSYKGLREYYRKEQAPESEWGKLAEEAADAGAFTGYSSWLSFEDARKKLERRIAKGSLASAFGRDGIVGQFISDFNAVAENGVRLAVYAQMRRAGSSKQDAATYARNITVNFNRKGEWGPTINSLFMFANAGIQGSHRVLQAAHRSPKVKLRLAGLAVSMAVLDQLNRVMSPDDEDGRDAYDAIPSWERERNMIFMVPGSDRYVKIPLPYGFNVAGVLGSVASRVGGGPDSLMQGIEDLVSAALGSFNPVGSDPTVSPLQFVAPTILDPAVQIAENKTWFGGPIVPDGGSWDTRPDSQKATKNVSDPARWVSSWLNRVTGGDEVEGGWIDVSPNTLDHLAFFAAGGLGSFTKRMGGGVRAMIDPDNDLEPKDVPLFRRFWGGASESRSRQLYFDQREAIEMARRRLNNAKESGDAERAREIARESAATLRLEGLLKGTEKLRRGLRRRANATGGDVRELELQAMRRFNRRAMAGLGG